MRLTLPGSIAGGGGRRDADHGPGRDGAQRVGHRLGVEVVAIAGEGPSGDAHDEHHGKGDGEQRPGVGARRHQPESYPAASNRPATAAARGPYDWPDRWPPASSPNRFLAAIRERIPDLRLLTDADRSRDLPARRDRRTSPPGCPGPWPSPPRPPRSPSSSGSAASSTCRSCRVAPAPGCRGGATGIDGALTIAFTAMDRILEIDARRTCASSRSPGSSTPGSRRRSPSTACSTRPIPRASRCARSAGTSGRTRAACAASNTARPASRCSGSRS